MIEVSRRVGKNRSSNYTIMIIPGKTGITKNFHITRKSVIIISSLFLAIICGILFFGMYSMNNLKKQDENYLALQDDYLILKSQNKDLDVEIKSLQSINEFQNNQINEYKNQSLKVKDKLIELMEIEKKLNTLLIDEGISHKLSRGNINKNIEINIEKDIDLEIERLSSLIDKMNEQVLVQRKIPAILPCSGTFTSYFGKRTNAITGQGSEFHSGLDIANDYATPIHAAGDGVISFAGWQGGYGNVVIINHENGYKSFYGHNSKLLVKQGQAVQRDDKIALMGSTGRSTGNHCHFEIRLNDKPINPFNLVRGGN